MVTVKVKENQHTFVEVTKSQPTSVNVEGEIILKNNGNIGDFIIGDNMLLENGVLSVKTTDDLSDSKLPITSYGVQKTVGNIEVLLKSI